MNVGDLIREKREEILALAEKHGARNVRIFGSAARGEAGPESDVDFLVDAGPNRTPWFPAGLIRELEELLGCKVDVVTENALHWYIKERVLEEAASL